MNMKEVFEKAHEIAAKDAFVPKGLESLIGRFNNASEEKCTCKENSKQRAICPVCDKEEYDEIKKSNLAEKKK